MATTAIQPAPTPTPSANPNVALLVSSVVGAAFVLGGVVLAGVGVPLLLKNAAIGNSFVTAFVRILAQLAVVVGMAYAGGKVAGPNPPKGLRGGIFLVISTVITFFFVVRAVALNFGDMPGAVAAALMAFLSFRFLTGRGIGMMHALEEQGWFHTTAYKASQGRKMRRYTLIGLLLVGLSGVWALMHRDALAAGDLVYKMPFGIPNFTALTDQQYSVPLLIAAATLWLAWRAVNIPTFADFLIATEAEMNKVSWASRKRLVQDTIVVLVTTLLLTLFLLVVDLFWGWFLADLLHILPKADPTKVKQSDESGQKTPW